jgi:hypothetical protein
MVNRLAVTEAWSDYMEVTYPELKGREFINIDEHPMKGRAMLILSLLLSL